MEAAKQLLMDVVQEMYEQNNFRIPGVKRVREMTGLTVTEAKELLEECKPLLKKTKTTTVQPEQSPSEKSEDELVKQEPAESEPAAMEIGETKEESQASFTPEQPDNQEGLSPGVPAQSEGDSAQPTDLDSPSEKAKLETQRRRCMWTSCFCCFVLALQY